VDRLLVISADTVGDRWDGQRAARSTQRNNLYAEFQLPTLQQAATSGQLVTNGGAGLPEPVAGLLASFGTATREGVHGTDQHRRG